MCLTVPMKVEEINGPQARCTAMGQERWASLALVEHDMPKVGEYVVIHLKFVQRTVPEHEALEAYGLFEEIIEALESNSQNNN